MSPAGALPRLGRGAVLAIFLLGLGLRLGSSRSSFGNVIHIDLAFPLDGAGDDDIDDVQLLVTTKGSF